MQTLLTKAKNPKSSQTFTILWFVFLFSSSDAVPRSSKA